jgi:hypothetical protein
MIIGGLTPPSLSLSLINLRRMPYGWWLGVVEDPEKEGK